MNNISIYLIIIILVNVSCSDQFSLNQEPVSQISNITFWKSQDDANSALDGMYTSLRSQAENSNLLYLGEARSETMARSFANAPARKYFENTLSEDDPGPSWRGFYRVVNDANLILKNVPNINFDSSKLKNDILAQAYTMRAYVYFVMLRTWGDVPLITEPSDPNAGGKERAPKEQIFQFIKDDLDKAVDLFPNNNFPSCRCKWSLPAANVLKANVYLWTGKKLGGGKTDIETALEALNEAEKTDVKLLNNFSDVFDYNNKGNKEVIMAIHFEQFESGSNWGSRSYMIPIYASPLFNKATLKAIGVYGGSPHFTVSDQVRAQYTKDDLRKERTFYEMYITDPETEEKSFYGSFGTKYKGFTENGQRLFLDDIVLYRYADVLLLKAEAKNALGQNPSDEINQVRQRAYGSNFDNHVFTSGSIERNNKAILKERLLEFTLEGKRWWDLLRFGKAVDKVQSLDSNKPLLFPIPPSVLSLNSKISQNKGY